MSQGVNYSPIDALIHSYFVPDFNTFYLHFYYDDPTSATSDGTFTVAKVYNKIAFKATKTGSTLSLGVEFTYLDDLDVNQTQTISHTDSTCSINEWCFAAFSIQKEGSLHKFITLLTPSDT